MGRDSWGEVILDGWHFKLAQPMEFIDLTRFQGRVITGAPDLTSNPLLSTWVISNLMGGHGIDKLQEGTDQNRYRWSTLYARIPNQLSLPRYTRTVTGPNSTRACPLGDLYESGTYKFYADYGGKLVRWTEATLTMSASLGNLAGASVNKGVEFKGTGTRKLFIPAGANGYSTWDGTTLATAAAPLAQAFCLWDNKLVCLDTDGQLHWTVNGTTWTGGTTGDSYGVSGKLDASYIPINILVYYDRADNPCIHVVSNRGVWSFDPAGPRLYLTDAQWPSFPNQGLASDKWRGTMYVSNGMGITQFNGNLINPGIGLDRDNGLPANYRGYITDLQQEYNGLYALVVGKTTTGSSYVSVNVYTSFGWHCEYASTSQTATSKITWMQISQGNGAYRLWWGENGSLKSIALPTDFANPRALDADSSGSFEGDIATFESGRFDAEMANYIKVANTLEVKMTSAASPARFYYRRNGDTAYTELLYLSDPVLGWQFGTSATYQFGTALTGGSGYTGVSFFDIEIKASMTQGASGEYTRSPQIEYMALTYRQMIPSGYSWTAALDLMTPHAGKSPEQMRDKLDALIAYAGFFEMTYQHKVYRVCLAQLTGNDAPGDDTRGVRRLNILEVKSTGIASGPSITG